MNPPPKPSKLTLQLLLTYLLPFFTLTLQSCTFNTANHPSENTNTQSDLKSSNPPRSPSEAENLVSKNTAELKVSLTTQGAFLKDDYIDTLSKEILERILQRNLLSKDSYNIVIIKNPVPNAFALSDGTVCIHTGLLAHLTHPDQLAFVIAHELSHIINKHAVNQFKNVSSSILAANLFDTVLSPIAAHFQLQSTYEYAIGYLSQAAVKGYGRDLEREADEYGLKLLLNAKINPQRGVELFTILNKLTSRYETDGLLSLLMSHPSNQERLSTVTKFLEDNNIKIPDTTSLDIDYMQKSSPVRFKNALWNRRSGRYFEALEELNSLKDFVDSDQEKYALLLEEARNYRSMILNFNFTRYSISASYWEDLYAAMTKDQIRTVWFKNALVNLDAILSSSADANNKNINEIKIKALKEKGFLMHDKDHSTGQAELKKYLELNPTAADKRYIEFVLRD